MTKRPEMTPVNYADVYDYYRGPNMRPWVNNLLHIVGKSIFRPNVLITEETEELIHQQFALGKGALIACNHPSPFDAVVLPGALRATGISELQETGAIVKDSLYRGPMRIVSEGTGSIPLFREKSYRNIEDENGLLSPEDKRALLSRASRTALDIAAERLRGGKSMVIMPEGTNSSTQARTNIPYEDIKAGVATIAQGAGDQRSFILPVGIHYRTNDDGTLRPRHAIVAISEPVTEYAESKQEIKRQVHDGMSKALSHAVMHLRELQQS